MRSDSVLLPLAATSATAFWLVASLYFTPGFASAAEVAATSKGVPVVEASVLGDQQASPCTCPDSSERARRPKFAGLELDDGDELAALESVHHALSAVGDGARYIWHRNNGHLSGLVQPTTSYRNDDGEVCRHVLVMLTTGLKTAKTEATACRMSDKRWRLGG